MARDFFKKIALASGRFDVMQKQTLSEK